MGVFSSISDGVGALQRNPLIVALVFAYMLVATGVSSLQVVDPLLVYPAMFVLYLFLPFYIGGMIGVIDKGLDGKTSLGRFFDAGKSGFLSLFGGGLILGIITIGLYFVLSILLFVVLIFAIGFSVEGAGGADGVATATIAILAVLSVLSFLLVMLPWFVLQFFPAAVVVDDLGLVDSLKRSGGLVKNNFLSVVGFDAVAVLIGLLAQIPTGYLFYQLFQRPWADFASEPGATVTAFDLFSTTELAIYFGLTLLLGTVVGSVVQSYYVAFYDQLPRGDAA